MATTPLLYALIALIIGLVCGLIPIFSKVKEDVNKLKSNIKRKSVLKALNNNTATMQVTGTLFMELDKPTVGGKIKIEVTSMVGDETVLDEQKSGEFIISSIIFIFNLFK